MVPKTIALTPVEGERVLPAFIATVAPVSLRDGFYEPERDDVGVFHWMQRRGCVEFEPRPVPRYLEVPICSDFLDRSQVVTATIGGETIDIALVRGWLTISLVVPAGTDRLELAVNKEFPRAYYPEDHRTLAIRVRAPRLHEDAERHRHVRRQQVNAGANLDELLQGRVALTSTPPALGIDLHGACNVKPPCVYCEWDLNKALEGDQVDAPFTVGTLHEWGEFFDNSVSLVNCSIGEPFMMRNLDELLDVVGDRGKILETTTNGQILTDRNIQKLLGREIDLYVSLDAATPLTYSRLRNDAFEKILRNLRRLIEAKGGPGRTPRVHLVFMPMRINVHELDAFVQLCADLRVDRLVLRPLNYSDTIDLNWERAGYRYQYKKELLPFIDLVRASGRATELCRRLGVTLADQMDFGGSLEAKFQAAYDEGRRAAAAVPLPVPLEVDTGAMRQAVIRDVQASVSPVLPTVPVAKASVPVPDALREPAAAAATEARPSLGEERMPACTEPWKSLYILRRGIFPCCYGGAPIAPMENYRQAWNSELMQDIRRELLGGHFHEYCIRSPACPVVRKSQEASELPFAQAVWLKTHQIWSRFDRWTLGRARVVSPPFIRAVRIVMNPRRSFRKFREKLAGS